MPIKCDKFTYHIVSKDFVPESVEIFFEETLKNFINESFNFFKEWGEFPFIYGERQLNSALIPAIHCYTDTIFTELPFKDTKRNQRFLDIVTTKRKSIFLIELKHAFHSKNERTTERADNEWRTSVDQVSDLRKSVVKKYYNYNEYDVYRIALLVMPTYLLKGVKHDILKYSAKKYAEYIDNDYAGCEKEKYKPNLIGVIKINKPNKYVCEFEDREEVYPFITFVAKVEKV